MTGVAMKRRCFLCHKPTGKNAKLCRSCHIRGMRRDRTSEFHETLRAKGWLK